MFSLPVITIFKYGFLGLVVTGAGFLIANTAVPRHYKNEALEDLSYKARVSVWNDFSIFDRTFMKCLTEPSEPFCRIPKNRRLKLLRNQHHVSHGSKLGEKKMPQPRQHSKAYEMMFDFLSVMNSLKVKPFLLEPSMLFCILSPYQKYNLISNGLNADILQGSKTEITFGIFEKDSTVLSHENSTKKYQESGYEFSSSQSQSKNDTPLNKIGTYFSFARRNLTIRVIVLFERGTFLWHPSSSDSQKAGSFAQASSFDNFTQLPLQLENGMETGFYLPSELNRFLLQIQRSKFEECPLASKMLSPHLTLSHEQLYVRVSIVIQEFKAMLRPLMGTFWIWKETLSGWNENCNLFEKTSEFNVALPVDILSKINKDHFFINNEYLQLEYQDWEHQLILECHGLKINVFIIYEDSRSVWDYEKNIIEQWIKNSYQKFELCSFEVMGLLVNKPCRKFLKR